MTRRSFPRISRERTALLGSYLPLDGAKNMLEIPTIEWDALLSKYRLACYAYEEASRAVIRQAEGRSAPSLAELTAEDSARSRLHDARTSLWSIWRDNVPAPTATSDESQR